MRRRIADGDKIWVKSDYRGIRVVQMHGFMEVKLFDTPPEISYSGFKRWCRLVSRGLE